MRTFHQWMDEYGVSHQNPTNQIIHKICVPLIMLSVIGLMWAIPTPAFFPQFTYVNWATLFVAGCLVFYLTLNWKMFLGMLVLTFAMITISHELSLSGYLIPTNIAIFVVSWIAQFYGHKVEGKKPSFLKDLVFLLIGPLWVLRFFYQKMGIKI
jgi:uncharacterized membrane protein YGL010W